jgi:hypothetical protein
MQYDAGDAIGLIANGRLTLREQVTDEDTRAGPGLAHHAPPCCFLF